MCGRYSQTLSMAELARRYSAAAPKQLELKPRWNLAPSQQAPVVTLGTDGAPALELMRWGLIPGWAKDEKIGYKMINARAETAAEKPGFRKALELRRCLVPADGFYEWVDDAATKARLPRRIVRRDRASFAMAGLWERWKAPDGREVRSFTILTTAANALIKEVHERMPVILRPKDEAAWLAAPAIPPALDPEHLEIYAVSALVNSPKNDLPVCVEPLAPPTENR
jgi:putative SOS response-associated peptidase YedK